MSNKERSTAPECDFNSSNVIYTLDSFKYTVSRC